VRLKFSDLFDGLGGDSLRYGAACEKLAGREVEIRGWLSPAHDGSGDVMLVQRQGECPDCAPAPVAAIFLPGCELKETGAVTLRGVLSYGFHIHGGKASFLRLEQARLATGIPT
jgi:hypothetical protein